jgi:hypothetical protein
MPAVTQTISNFLGGVSRQNDDKKLLNQVTECVNGYPDPTFGLLKRPGMEYINSLKKADGTTFTKAELADAAWFFIERDAAGSYIGAIKGTNIYVWTAADGTWCPVTNNSPGYLNGTKQSDYHFRSVQDTTIITNRTVTTAMSPNGTFVARSVGTVKLINLNASETYSVKLQGQITSYDVASSDTFDDFLIYDYTRHGGNERFCELLVDTITAQHSASNNAFKGTWYLDSYTNSLVIRRTNAGVDTSTNRIVANGIIVSQNGSKISNPSTAFTFQGKPVDFNITGRGGLSNLDLEVFQDSVVNISDLPSESFHGHNVEILNNDSGDDNYYVEFVAYDEIDGPGYWNETVARDVSAGFNEYTMPHELVDTGAPVTGNEQIYETIGLEGWTSTHNSPLLFTQALNDPTGGENQATWLQDYVDGEFGDLTFSQPGDTATIQTIPGPANVDLAHAAFTSDSTLQAAIRTHVGGTNPSGTITNDQFTIVPTDGETYTVDGTSYPVMGKLYIPTGLAASQIDVLVVFHGTVESGTIQDASETALTQFLNQSGLNLRDKIIFSAAYPQDHISSTDQYDLPNVGVESSTFLMGDNLPYARAAVKWAKNSLNSYMSGKSISKTIGDVYLFGHSQGGKLVTKMNTLETGITAVAANSPGPIRFGETCSSSGGSTTTSCKKVSAIYGAYGVTTFTFGPINWVARKAGDDNTSPVPAFIGDPITSTFYFNNRLGFLSTDNINFSVANDPYNFFVKSALTLIDSDPIDLNVSSIRPVTLSDVLPSSQGLLVFSERQQFQVFTTDGSTITPTSTVVRSISNYEMNKNIAPVDVGTTAAFVSNVTGYSKLFTLQLQDIEQPPIVIDISKVVLNWIPDTIDDITVSPQNSVLMMIDRDTSYLYLYRYYNNGEKDLFQAWTKWQLPGTIQTAKILNDAVITISQHEDEYTIGSITLDEIPTGDVVATSTGITGNSCLDMATRPVSPATGVDAVVYDEVNDVTKIYVPYTPIDEKPAVMLLSVPEADVGTTSVIDADAGYYAAAEERTESGTGYRYFEVKGNFSNYADGIVVGYGNDFEVTLPKFYYRPEATVADFTAALTVSRVKFSVGKTGAIRFKVKADGSNEWKNVESTVDGDRYSADSNPVKDERQFTVPIHQRNTNFELKVTSDFPYPVSLVSMTWEGIYSPRFYRRA